ncbi:MAG TPA: YfdX family protein [Planctomycetes bacterium]|nr:YfdX family protein [Planctomycetota bacterium]
MQIKGMVASLVFLGFLAVPGTLLSQSKGSKNPVQAESVQNASIKKAKDQDRQTKRTQDRALNQTQGQVTQKREHIVKEAVRALQLTKDALDSLNKGNQEKALDDLAMAIGKLELVVARYPDLALVPVSVELSQVDLVPNEEFIKKAVERSKAYLDSGELQKARHLLGGLASELIVRKTNIPLGIYPSAIKAIGPLLDRGKIEKAKTALTNVLNTLVVTETIVPLPVLRASILLSDAEVLAEKKNRSDKEQKELEESLDLAREQVHFAELLGYGSPKEYQAIYDQITEIAKKTAEKKQGTGFFEKIKKSLKALRRHSQKAPKNKQ